MSFQIIQGTLGSDVANSSTFTASTPSNLNAGAFAGGVNHKLAINQIVYSAPADFTVSISGNTATITNTTGKTLPANSSYILQLEQIGGAVVPDIYAEQSALSGNVVRPRDYLINLGSPVAASSTQLATSQAVTAASATGATLAATSFGTPRNVVAAWTGTAVLTVRGTDMYGNALTESSASGTSFTGKKAFKTISSIKVSADVTGLTAGSGTVLGLPFFLNGSGYVLREIVNGAAAGTAGTFVAGLSSGASTATSADVRGTYSPNSAPNGSNTYQLYVIVPDVDYAGAPQFAA